MSAAKNGNTEVETCINFTKDSIAKAFCIPPRRETFYRDTGCPGLGLRVTNNCAKSFIFETSKCPRYTIGPVASWLDEATPRKNYLDRIRAEANRLMTMVNQGIDPRQDRAAKELAREVERHEARRKDVLFADAWKVYIADRMLNPGNKSWGDAHRLQHEEFILPGGLPKKRGNGLTVERPLACLAPKTLPELTATLISGWMSREVAKRRSSARQAFTMLRTFANWTNHYKTEDGCVAYAGLIPADSFGSKSVTEKVPKGRQRKDHLERVHLAMWFDAMDKIDNYIFSTYLIGLLITGARRRELSSLEWDKVDFTWSRITIRDKATREERTIPLTPYFAGLLKGIPRRKGAKYVFTSNSQSGHIVSPNRNHTAALKSAGLPHVSLHGLRRSFSTLSNYIDMPTNVKAQIMGHKPQTVDGKHYDQRPMEVLQRWNNRLEAWVLAEAGIDFKPHEPVPNTGAGLRLVA